MSEQPQEPSPLQRQDADDTLAFIVGIVREAGEYLRNAIGDAVQTHWKPDNTPVTNMDIEINNTLIEKILGQYPADSIYGEEQSRKGTGDSEYTWTIDPIDGTQALGKLDTFTICVARLNGEGQPIVSVVYNPLRDSMFTARAGEQSFLNGIPLHVSSRDTIKSSYIHFGSGLRFSDLATNGIAYDRLEAEGAKIFNTRSLAHGAVEVAKGEFDGAYIGVKTPFEAAAVKLIVEGAGGVATDIYGNDPGRLDGEIRGMIVSNGRIHASLIAALHK